MEVTAAAATRVKKVAVTAEATAAGVKKTTTAELKGATTLVAAAAGVKKLALTAAAARV
jgi:hypothetical protein